jgi:hypothetical protein
MPKIASKTIKFAASGSPDVVGYKMYYEEVPGVVTYQSASFDLGNSTVVDLATLPGIENFDGVYNIGIAAVDDAGNESDFARLGDVPLDLQPPTPPQNLVIE